MFVISDVCHWYIPCRILSCHGTFSAFPSLSLSDVLPVDWPEILFFRLIIFCHMCAYFLNCFFSFSHLTHDIMFSTFVTLLHISCPYAGHSHVSYHISCIVCIHVCFQALPLHPIAGSYISPKVCFSLEFVGLLPFHVLILDDCQY